MKKLFIFLFLSTALSWLASAKQVEERMAGKVAGNFFAGRLGKNQLKALPTPVLVCTSNDLKTGQDAKTKAAPAFYVFNFTATPGFVIVSGDDIVIPVLAYSMEGSFSPANIAPGAEYWLRNYQGQIERAVAQKLQATPEIESAWHDLATTVGKSNLSNKSVKAVEPMVNLRWAQDPYYNNKCPWGKDSTGKKVQTVTGCAATAMAMLMKYHNYPKKGTGYYKYDTEKYGTLPANFGATTYKWEKMPEILDKNTDTVAVNAVATLMYHCGVSIEMTYGITADGGSSGAVTADNDQPCIANALKKYFGYDPSLRPLHRIGYTDEEWTAFLKEDLDARLPVIYAAFTPTKEGHAFVCDGYDNTGKFHFNWGWGGEPDTYFEINKLNPNAPDGEDYKCGEEIIKGVRPGQRTYYNLNLSIPGALISNVIPYNDSISLMTGIRNNGKTDFQGKLGAAIFDTNQVRIGFVEIMNPITILRGEDFQYITFKNSGLLNMLPGKYMIGIMYSAAGDDWIEVNDTLNYANFPLVEVINPDLLEMASVMTILPGTPLTEGKAATVKLEIRNIGSQSFSGTLNLAIHDIDGNYLYSLAQKSNFNLSAGSSSGELTFSTARIPVPAGSYLLSLWYKPSGTAEYDLIGSTGFQNPVKVQVNAIPLAADKYEPNNAEDSAYVFTPSFSGKNEKIIINANCHIAKDIDYYIIKLPMGYSYHGTASLENSEDDTTLSYPLKGLWDFKSPPDTIYKSPCSNSAPAEFTALKGGDLFFFVRTNFLAQTGMYQLEINISKNALGIEESDPSSTLAVYPNPSSGIVYLANGDAKGQTSEIIIRNMMGSTVYHQKSASTGSDPYRMDLSGFPAGIYIATVRDSNQHLNHVKISIIK